MPPSAERPRATGSTQEFSSSSILCINVPIVKSVLHFQKLPIGCGLCAPFWPGSLFAQRAHMDERRFSQSDSTQQVERWTPSICGFCSVGCGLEIGSTGNQIVAVRGRVDHPVNRGRLGPKGMNQFYANRHPTRALYPMVRNRNGKLVRAT